jgi:hypothetical protein
MFTQRSIIFPKRFRDHSGDAAVFREGSILGSSDIDKIFENCFASCSFGLAKDI